MKLFSKLFIFLIALNFLVGCNTLKKSLTPQKKKGGDEFLVKKKSPLVMPPNFNKLPKPEIKKEILEEKTNIKQLITGEEVNFENEKIEQKSSIENLILKNINKK
tara:strand:- start:217 stop:531 length:315 start_codon:yes stop_codon:yes gene_type:complete